MKQKVSLVILALFLFQIGYAQLVISSKSEEQILKTTPLETIYINTNRNNFFPGEYLYFSLFCINMKTYKLSEISKVAYVKLIAENGEEISTQKIRLKNGLGQGDIFVETSIPSGSYKLVAFTHWMKNAPASQAFNVDIAIINPYKNNQEALISSSKDSLNNSSANSLPKNDNSSVLKLKLNKVTYANREAVELSVINDQKVFGHGNYSLSVTHIDKLPSPNFTSAENFVKVYPDLMRQIPQTVGDTISFPEQRGELISGKITYGETDLPVAKTEVAISLPGEYFQLKAATTYPDGKFFAYANAPYNGETAVIEMVEPDSSNYTINSYDPSSWSSKLSGFFEFEIDSTMKESIRNRSIYNQIENSYYEVKPDTVLQWQGVNPYNIDPFYGEPPTVYNLDEYTRFNTLQETLVEFIEHVWVKKFNNGDYTFWVRTPLDDVRKGEYTTDPPLVTIDGILMPNHNNLLSFNARRLKSIKVLRHPLVLDNKNYQGMVALETIDGNYIDEWRSAAGKKISYRPSTMEKQYYSQGSSLDAHIPDYRYQLHWLPHFRLKSPEKQILFYTSDVKGTYRIRLEGFTDYGKPVSSVQYFEVE
ncbi:hypothetical protein SAMN03097699_3010 [Flavobacteriaceae bacterium MAR_2010_188]|nr:hypothetical protein SAMN03097699_3010 [Flavobacteriaceae bacterium MAR_2010_188]